jgi:hypothetical protein
VSEWGFEFELNPDFMGPRLRTGRTTLAARPLRPLWGCFWVSGVEIRIPKFSCVAATGPWLLEEGSPGTFPNTLRARLCSRSGAAGL